MTACGTQHTATEATHYTRDPLGRLLSVERIPTQAGLALGIEPDTVAFDYDKAGRLVAEHGGQVPRARAALEALPGVGRKTANVVLNIAFGEPTIAVDTHIFRVGNRTGLAVGKTPLDVEMKLMQVVPEKYRLHAHHWLILHGRYICIARKPNCERCVVSDLCAYPAKSGVMPKPAKKHAKSGRGQRV